MGYVLELLDMSRWKFAIADTFLSAALMLALFLNPDDHRTFVKAIHKFANISHLTLIRHGTA